MEIHDSGKILIKQKKHVITVYVFIKFQHNDSNTNKTPPKIDQ